MAKLSDDFAIYRSLPAIKPVSLNVSGVGAQAGGLGIAGQDKGIPPPAALSTDLKVTVDTADTKISGGGAGAPLASTLLDVIKRKVNPDTGHAFGLAVDCQGRPVAGVRLEATPVGPDSVPYYADETRLPILLDAYLTASRQGSRPIAAVSHDFFIAGPRVTQMLDEGQRLDEGARPPVGEHQRGLGSASSGGTVVHEMEAHPVDVGQAVFEPVEPPLPGTPVEPVGPVLEQSSEVVQVDALRPRLSRRRIGPARAPDPLAQVVEHGVRHRDLEGFDLHLGMLVPAPAQHPIRSPATVKIGSGPSDASLGIESECLGDESMRALRDLSIGRRMLAVAVLACARLGAAHSVIFGGFAPHAIMERAIDADSKVIITADGGYRRGDVVPLQKNVEEALDLLVGKGHIINHVVVVKRTAHEPPSQRFKTGAKRRGETRFHWYHDVVGKASPACPCESMDSEDMLFLLYTSGSTGKPKGILHTTAGYLAHVQMTMRLTFNAMPDAGQLFWCSADIGWITGHSYVVYGPLMCRVPTLMFEGAPNFPGNDRFWDIIERHRVSIFYTAPTAIRAFMRWGDEWPKKHDLLEMSQSSTNC